MTRAFRSSFTGIEAGQPAIPTAGAGQGPGADECPSCGVPGVPTARSVHGRVPVMARRLPTLGPTWPVADAATGGLRTFILLYGRGVS